MTASVADLYRTSVATALAAHVRAGDVSAAELAEAAIAVIEASNPALNAVICKLYDLGRAVAQNVDRNAPLAGVPFLLKELTTILPGVPATNSCRFLQHLTTPADSEATRRIKAAGLVLFGNTNAPENGWSIATEPVLYGPTLNPWDVSVTPGGSSNGSDCAIATGLVPIAEASDGVGSIQIPASNCGVIGLKPTRGWVSLSRFADYWAGGACFLCVTRTMRDTAAYLDAVAGALPGDAYPVTPPPAPSAELARRAPEKLRIGFTLTPPNGNPLHQDVAQVMRQTTNILSTPGHDVEEYDMPFDAASLWRSYTDMTCVETANMFNNTEAVVGRAVTPQDVEPVTRAIIERGRATMATNHAGRIEAVRQAGRAIVQDLCPYEVFISPTLTQPPRPVGYYDMSMTNLDAYNALWLDADFAFPFNISEQPAMSGPIGVGATGLPSGVQLIARLGADATLFALGMQLEEIAPWRDRRPPISQQK